MKITALFFGHYREIANGEPVEIDAPQGTTVRQFALILEDRFPLANALATYCRFALNEAYVSLETELSAGDTVAVLPPMSGG